MLAARHSEPHAAFRTGLERAPRPNRQPTVTEVERERGGDGVAEAILHRNSEDRTRPAAAIEVVGKEVGGEGRQYVLARAVFVEIPGDAERRERPHFVGIRNRPAE